MGEGFGRDGGEVGRERAEASPFQPAFTNQFEAYWKRRDKWRGVWWVENGAWMAVECERPRVASEFPGAADGLGKDATMAEVNAVEESRSEDCRPF